MNINIVHILGRMCKDPELRSLTSGTKVVNFSIATNHIFKNKDGSKNESVEYHNCVSFARTAEVIKQYVVKGQLIYVQGRLKTSSYEDKGGVKRYKTEIVVDQMQMGPRALNAEVKKEVAPIDEYDGLDPQSSVDPQDIDPQDIPF